MFKCNCCGNDMTRLEVEEYDKMSQEQITGLIKKHKEDCAWAKQLQLYYDTINNKGDILKYSDLLAIDNYKMEVIIDILLEKGFVDKQDLKNRIIVKANRGIDFNARDKIVEYLNKKY